MSEVFKRTALSFGGAFSATQGVLLLGIGSRSAITPFLIQNIGLNFSQQITRLYELADGITIPSVYDVGGRAQGALALSRVIGPRILMEEFYSTYGNICNAPTNSLALDMRPGCDLADPALHYTLRYCLLSKTGISISAQDLLVSENSELTFNVLEHTQTQPDDEE